jgi:hypothetical protein
MSISQLFAYYWPTGYGLDLKIVMDRVALLDWCWLNTSLAYGENRKLCRLPAL